MKLVRSYAFLLLLVLSWFTGQRVNGQTSGPANQEDDRLTFLLIQLGADEQSIRAINIALRQTGYKVAEEQGRVQQAQKGNELMDRNAGGPISYKDFYGKSAKSYSQRDILGIPHQVRRPPQFDYIYRANADQAAKARDEIESIGKHIDALLARRHQLEAEQSALWLTIAFEPLEDRQIPYRPLYRFQPKPASAESPAVVSAKLNVLRPAIVFLSICDKAMSAAVDSVSTDQKKTLDDLNARVGVADETLQGAMAQAKLSTSLTPPDLQSADNLSQLARRMKSQCKNIVDAYRLAQDEGATQDDARKPMFRGQLQGALLAFSGNAAELDDGISQLAANWKFQPDTTSSNPDLQNIANAAATAAAPSAPVPPAVSAPAAMPPAANDSEGWVDLFNGRDMTGWTLRSGRGGSDWKIEDGALVSRGAESMLVTAKTYTNFRVRAEMMINDGGVSSLLGRVQENKGLKAGNYAAYIATEGEARAGSIYWTPARGRTRAAVTVAQSDARPGQWFTIELDCIGTKLVVLVNGKQTAEHNDRTFARGAIGIEQHGSGSVIKIRKIQVQEVK